MFEINRLDDNSSLFTPMFFLDYRPYDMYYAHFELNRIISMLVYFIERAFSLLEVLTYLIIYIISYRL